MVQSSFHKVLSNVQQKFVDSEANSKSEQAIWPDS